MDQSDSGLVRLETELRLLRAGLAVNVVLGDVSRVSDVRNVVRDARPHAVYHAAACGEISTCDRAVCATVRTNVFGTLHVAREAASVGARLVLISSREADAGTTVGATRRLGELVSMCPSAPGFRPLIVRIDDVIERPAAPVDILLEQLRHGKPLLIPEAVGPRTLMTAREAVSLILKADLVGRAGEVYRMDAGAAIDLATIARRLLAWADSCGIRTVPLRVARRRTLSPEAPNCLDPLPFESAGHPGLQVAQQRVPDTVMMSRILRALREDLRRRDALTALADLRAAVPGFLPSRAAREVAGAVTLHAGAGVTWRAVQGLSV
jgi:nucleoside-diphosphate-sugar epimerase